MELNYFNVIMQKSKLANRRQADCRLYNVSLFTTLSQDSTILLSTDLSLKHFQMGLFRLLRVQIDLSADELGYKLSAIINR